MDEVADSSLREHDVAVLAASIAIALAGAMKTSSEALNYLIRVSRAVIAGQEDIDTLLMAANRLHGDANFDGEVQFSDFLVLSDNFGQAGGWGKGDFDGDGEIAFSDFLPLADNFGVLVSNTAPVPEPTGVYLAIFGVLRLGHIR